MDKFVRLTAAACPVDIINLNTDQLLPARFLKRPRAEGIGDALLRDLRFDSASHEVADFPLNRPAWRDAKIIVGARNFGCGSSREAAVYALVDYGIRCVIAPSFGDIFSGNAVQNGLLTAIVTDMEAADISAMLAHAPDLPLTVDLETQTIVCGNHTYAFTVDPVRRAKLINGLDDIGLTETYRDRIATFVAEDHMRRPWAVPGGAS